MDWLGDSSIDYIFPISTPILVLISSVCCYLILKIYLKKLNILMKTVLIALTIHNLFCSLVALVLLIYMNHYKIQTFEICRYVFKS